MNTPTNFRAVLAAAGLLAMLAAAYGAAVRLAPLPASAPPLTETSLSTDSATAAETEVLSPKPELSTPAPEPTPEPVRPVDFNRPVFERGHPAQPRVLHHYVGTVGGQPATALLSWQHPDSVWGSFYLHRGGPEYALAQPYLPDPAPPRSRHQQQGQVLAALTGEDGSGTWHLRGRPGATLTGTWRGGPTGRPQAVLLHESYAGAVRLAIEPWRVHGRYTVKDDRGNDHSSVTEVAYDFMHLPDPSQVPAALRPLLSPGPAARRRLLLEGGDFDCITSQRLTVQLNDFGLFSYEYEDGCSIIGGAADERYRRALLDLRAGRWLTMESQLRSGYEPHLSILMARHLLHDAFSRRRLRADGQWPKRLRPYLATEPDTLRATACLVEEVLPALSEAVYTGAGLALDCWWGDFIEASPRDHLTLLVPYRELRPLVRPGTPLARMLRARGMR